jgi:hypothetical protein
VQDFQNFNAANNTQNPIISPASWLGIEMRPDGNGRKTVVFPGSYGKDIANCIDLITSITLFFEAGRIQLTLWVHPYCFVVAINQSRTFPSSSFAVRRFIPPSGVLKK